MDIVQSIASNGRHGQRFKVILLYASAGAGHRSACEAVKRSLLDICPDADVELIDVLTFFPKPLAWLYSNGYLFIVSKYPMLWYFIYEFGADLSDFKPNDFLYRLVSRPLFHPLFRYLKSQRPDAIFSSHFMSSWAAGRYKKVYDNSCQVSTVITDYGIHPTWISSNQDMVFVATEQLKAELSPFSCYLGTDNIIPTGIPIHPDFSRPVDRAALQAKFGLDPNRYTILILGGMFGAKNIRGILLSLTGCLSPIQLVIVTGKQYPIDEYVKEKLIEAGIKYEIFGFIDFMNDVMAVSDLAITKAGALTISECLARELPLVIYRPYPGQEVRNCDYFLEQGVAVRVDHLSGLSFKIDSILQQPGRLSAMKERIRQVVRLNSSREIAEIILNFKNRTVENNK